MGSNGLENDEVMKEFLTESYEGLERMAEELLRLEHSPHDGALVASLFRTIHTLKGTCGFLGLSKLEAFSHLAENVLTALRDGKIQVSDDLISALMMSNELCARMLTSIDATGTEGDADTSKAEALLRSMLHPGTQSQHTEAPSASERMASRTPPAPPPALERSISVAPASEADQPTLGEILVRRGAVAPAAVASALAAQQQGDPRKLGEILVDRMSCRPIDVKDALMEQGETHVNTALENIRVDISLLDRLMNQVGELVLIRNQIQQFTSRFSDRGFASAAQRLNLITTELQEGVVKTRMQPIGTLWNKFPRLLRHLSKVLERHVELEMIGNETEIDRTIIEAIRDPLTHIIRNSVDHGIEAPAQRVAAGKSPVGHLTLRAFHEGGQVNIEIADDGRGINADALREKAVASGMLSALEASRLSEREALTLVFRAGLSTAKEVTNISGRGVGMDVVKTNIERIGGTIDLLSVRGKGTTIRIKIPLTLAVIPALMVTTGGERYAIPQVNLLEVLRLDGQSARGAIEYVAGAPVYRLRGNLLPIVYLSQQLDDEPPSQLDEVNIVVVAADERSFGLVVDEINDTAEIVVKPLSCQLKGIGIFAGATILGDGCVALILDVVGLAQHAHIGANQRERALAVDACAAESTAAAQSERLLLLGVGADRQLALPLSVVSRLEEVPISALELAGGRSVIQYRGTLLPLVSLASVIGVTQTPQDPLQVVVYSHQRRSIGLIVDRIVDVVERERGGPEVPCNARGIRGSTVIQKRVTDLLDLDQIAPANQVEEAVSA